MLREELPYVNAAGNANADAEIHAERWPCPQFALGDPITLGRSFEDSLFAGSPGTVTLKGNPVCAVIMPFNCQCPKVLRSHAL